MANSETAQLLPTLQQVATGLADPANHYMLQAHWYEREGQRVLFAAVYLHCDCAWNFELGPDAVAVDVLLDRRHLDRRSRISIPYAELYGVQHYAGDDFSGTFLDRHTLYFSSETMASLTPRLKELLQAPQA